MCYKILHIVVVEESKQWKSILISTMHLAGYGSIRLTSNTRKWSLFKTVILQQDVSRGNRTMKVNFMC